MKALENAKKVEKQTVDFWEWLFGGGRGSAGQG